MKTPTLSPRRLLKLFIAVSLLALGLILLLVSGSIERIFLEHNTRDAEHDSVNIGYVLFEEERKTLMQIREGVPTLAIFEVDFAGLDQRMRSFLAPLDIIKIKMFSRSGEIIYSTDHSIIGEIEVSNPRLDAALMGEVFSKLETKHGGDDHGSGNTGTRDVVETYLPVRSGAGEIIGAFEMYKDITKYRSEIRDVIRSSLLFIGLLMLVVFGMLFVLMYLGTRELDQVQEDLRNLAHLDGLTGLANRRYLYDRLGDEFARARRRQNAGREGLLSVIMLDLDHFKHINDNYGHEAGDVVLKSVAGRLRRVMRREDLVGRYGGEEFLVVLPGADINSAKATAERIHTEIRDIPVELGKDCCDISASLGVAELSDGDGGPQSLVSRADEVLYQAKASGRDRVEVAA